VHIPTAKSGSFGSVATVVFDRTEIRGVLAVAEDCFEFFFLHAALYCMLRRRRCRSDALPAARNDPASPQMVQWFGKDDQRATQNPLGNASLQKPFQILT
jgi:hypothetical protein